MTHYRLHREVELKGETLYFDQYDAQARQDEPAGTIFVTLLSLPTAQGRCHRRAYWKAGRKEELVYNGTSELFPWPAWEMKT